jgi:hydroxymethylglutaryl-CoA reductase
VVRLRTGRREVRLPCNPDPAESDLTKVELPEFVRFSGGEAEVVSSAGEALTLLAREGRLRLSGLAWLVAAVALAAEAAVLRLYGGRPRGV